MGTSDIEIENPDEANCTEEEVDYFLGMIARVFPDIKVTRENIVYRFSGVRPLAFSNAKTTGQITRDHEIQAVGPGTGLNFPVYSLVGGKWTSFRAFSEQVTDKTLGFLGKVRLKDTRSLPIGGGRDYPAQPDEIKRKLDGIAVGTSLSVERVQVLFERYGTRADQIAAFIGQVNDVPLKSLSSYSRREIGYIAQHEKVVHLDDFLMRRSMLAMLGRLTPELVEEICDVLGEFLNWDTSRKTGEAARSLKLLAEKHGVRL